MLTKDAQQVCERRYFQKDKDGNVNEKWEDLANRVVNHVGKNDTEEFREKAYQIILDTEFLPNFLAWPMRALQQNLVASWRVLCPKRQPIAGQMPMKRGW